MLNPVLVEMDVLLFFERNHKQKAMMRGESSCYSIYAGGPSGGTGGRGGHVWAVADRNLNSLLSITVTLLSRSQK